MLVGGGVCSIQNVFIDITFVDHDLIWSLALKTNEPKIYLFTNEQDIYVTNETSDYRSLN